MTKRPSRTVLARLIIVAIVVATFQSISVNGEERLQTERPNVLVILADDLGHSDLGCYGSLIQTPNLDSLAARGVRMTNFYNTARCWPTRAALLTGYYPQQVGFDGLPADQDRGLPETKRYRRPDWAVLLPQRLQSAGYRSYHSGKWHLKTMPVKGGFDRSYLLKDQGRFFSPKIHWRDDAKLPPIERDSGYYGTTAIADHAIEVLTEHEKQYTDQPFFHFLAFTAPHFPLHALPEDIQKYKGLFDEGWDVARQRRLARMQQDGIFGSTETAIPLPAIEREVGPPYHFADQIAAYGPGEVAFPAPWTELNETQRQFQAAKMEVHAAMVDRMDQEIGRVLDQLEQMNAINNTLILFLSDNGGSAELMIRADGHDPNAPMGSANTHACLGPGWSMAANTPFRRHKTWVHEGGCHSPAIIHWPAAIEPAANRHNDTVCHVIDIVPTVLELAGINNPSIDGPFLPGRSFAAALTEQPMPARELWWCHEGHRAIRQANWKLVAAKGEPWELYDLSKDPTETNDLSTRFPERVSTLSEAWQTRTDAMRALHD